MGSMTYCILENTADELAGCVEKLEKMLYEDGDLSGTS